MTRKEKAVWLLRDLAVTVLKAKGVMNDCDGVSTVCYRDERLKIEWTPPIRGSCNPNQLDVWKLGDGTVKVLACVWGEFDDVTLTFMAGPWEDALRAAATGRKLQGSDHRTDRAHIAG